MPQPWRHAGTRNSRRSMSAVDDSKALSGRPGADFRRRPHQDRQRRDRHPLQAHPTSAEVVCRPAAFHPSPRYADLSHPWRPARTQGRSPAAADSLYEGSLGDDFRVVREAEFPGDGRRVSDFRRSGAIEAVAGLRSRPRWPTRSMTAASHSRPTCRTKLPSCAWLTRRERADGPSCAARPRTEKVPRVESPAAMEANRGKGLELRL